MYSLARVVFAARVIPFAADSAARVVELGHVSSSWGESVRVYGAASSAWHAQRVAHQRAYPHSPAAVTTSRVLDAALAQFDGGDGAAFVEALAHAHVQISALDADATAMLDMIDYCIRNRLPRGAFERVLRLRESAIATPADQRRLVAVVCATGVATWVLPRIAESGLDLAAGILTKRGLESVVAVPDEAADAAVSHFSSPLHVAAACGRADVVEVLLALPANPPLILARDLCGKTPLMNAVMAGEATLVRPMARALLAGGHHIAALRTSKGSSALAVAAAAGSVAAVLALLDVIPDSERAALLTAQDDHKMTPLLVACSVGDGATATALLRATRGATLTELVDAPDITGMTPLLYAARFGDAALVAELLAAGAHVNFRGATRTPPLLLAAERGNVDAAAALLASPECDVNCRASVRDAPACDERECDEDECDEAACEAACETACEGETPLIAAARDGSERLVHLLLSARPLQAAAAGAGKCAAWTTGGAAAAAASTVAAPPLPVPLCVDARGGEHAMSALGYAVLADAPAVVALLLAAGASPLVQDRDGRTAADIARELAVPAVVALFR
jgi:ankyrin repeat protein